MVRLLFLLAALCVLAGAENCRGSCESQSGKKTCTFTAEIDFYASETGYYKFKECGDVVQPVLEMEQGVTYRFVQNADTNWMHPLGFAYFPDGAHDNKDELEPGITQSGSSCASDNSCQTPRYHIDGKFVGGADGEGDFGLDVYEPTFAKGLEEWRAIRDAGTGQGYEVHLAITDLAHTGDLFYFCHIHSKMSGRIVVVNSEGTANNPDPGTPALYSHYAPSAFDKQCGTWGTDDYQKDSGKCPGGNFMFCDDHIAGGDSEATTFSSCMYALDCHMQHGMRTRLSSDPVAAFMHQMIPHHQNAVNMAKLLLKTGVKPDKDPEQEVESMLYEIINSQNKQITFMRGWLAEYEHGTSEAAQCGAFSTLYSPVCCTGSRRRLLFGGNTGKVGCMCK